MLLIDSVRLTVVVVVLECFIAFAPFVSRRGSGVLMFKMIQVLRDRSVDLKEVLGLLNLLE